MKSRGIYIFAAALAVLCGCDSNTSFIPERKMADILYDMYLLDQYVDDDPELKAQADSLSVYLPLLEKYGCDRDFFESSLHHYLREPDRLEVIVSDVKKRLEARMTELEHTLDPFSSTEQMQMVDSVKRDENTGDVIFW